MDIKLITGKRGSGKTHKTIQEIISSEAQIIYVICKCMSSKNHYIDKINNYFEDDVCRKIKDNSISVADKLIHFIGYKEYVSEVIKGIRKDCKSMIVLCGISYEDLVKHYLQTSCDNISVLIDESNEEYHNIDVCRLPLKKTILEKILSISNPKNHKFLIQESEGIIDTITVNNDCSMFVSNITLLLKNKAYANIIIKYDMRHEWYLMNFISGNITNYELQLIDNAIKNYMIANAI